MRFRKIQKNVTPGLENLIVSVWRDNGEIVMDGLSTCLADDPIEWIEG